jgi:hypothetical protein
MAAELSPTLQAFLLEQADTFKRDVESALIELDPLAFYRWAADRQYEDAAKFANTARKERDAERAAADLEKALKQALNDERNICSCVHCEPHRLAIHGNGCTGYHCSGSCLSSPLSRCGRCSTSVPLLSVVATGPYRTCQPCADIIRN